MEMQMYMGVLLWVGSAAGVVRACVEVGSGRGNGNGGEGDGSVGFGLGGVEVCVGLYLAAELLFAPSSEELAYFFLIF
jgi:hypothetical protein